MHCKRKSICDEWEMMGEESLNDQMICDLLPVYHHHYSRPHLASSDQSRYNTLETREYLPVCGALFFFCCCLLVGTHNGLEIPR